MSGPRGLLLGQRAEQEQTDQDCERQQHGSIGHLGVGAFGDLAATPDQEGKECNESQGHDQSSTHAEQVSRQRWV